MCCLPSAHDTGLFSYSVFSEKAPVILIIRDLAVYVNQNDVRTYLLNILIGNYNIRLTAQEIHHFTPSWNNNFTNATAAGVKFQITHAPDFFAIPDINNILTFQF